MKTISRVLIRRFTEFEIRSYLQLSDLYNSNNQNDKALKVLESAGKINADDPLVHLALADVYRD
ncbi:MAG: tetratricopeptide repeat protein, partial [Proteobacteria bacterium]